MDKRQLLTDLTIIRMRAGMDYDRYCRILDIAINLIGSYISDSEIESVYEKYRELSSKGWPEEVE